jgi:hypothetical protein
MNKKLVLMTTVAIAILFFTVSSVLACSGSGYGYRYPYRTTRYQGIFPAVKSAYDINWQGSCSQYVIRVPKITVTGGIRYTPKICQRIGIAWS